MMGMSSTEWSRYMHDVIGLEDAPAQINQDVVQAMQERYEQHLPVIDGAVEAVQRLASAYRLALASSANRPLIDTVLRETGLGELFEATVSSEEVARGKPAPDVYLEAARRLGVEPAQCVAVEDSTNGIRSAHAAGDAGHRDSQSPLPTGCRGARAGRSRACSYRRARSGDRRRPALS